tara:strand:+ start:851 stop:1339 length:489 start_codon:yes stop_codon:yes gene_type:complete
MDSQISIKRILPSSLFVALIFILDRLTKHLILELSQPLNELNIQVNSFLSFNLVWNDGIAFGLLSFKENFFYEVVTILIIIVSLLVLWFALRTKGIEKFGFLMILGGALGNLFDRMYYSSVIDFIDISYNNYHWFIFNVADIFITLGVVMLISLELLKAKKK